MATSEYGFYTKFDPATYFTDDRPFDTGLSRIALSNLNHLGDVVGQILVEDATHDVTLYREPAVASTTEFQWIHSYGPLQLALKPDGSPYPIRVRAASKSSNGHSTTLRFGVGVRSRLAGNVAAGNVVNTREIVRSSTTGAWVDPVVPGGGPGEGTLIVLPASTDYLVERVGESALVTGDPLPVRLAEVWIEVYGKTANVGSKPQLFGLYAAEYIGL